MSPNVASHVGHTSIRNLVLDQDNRAPDSEELLEMKKLVAEAMEDGAMGLGTSLIYPPASYSTTEELIELSKVASHYGGIYTTHLRSEGDNIFKALNEAFHIGKEADIHVEVYHLKLSLSRNWNKIDTLLYKLDSARAAGIIVTADMYPYIGSGTGRTARLPQWVQEGGGKEMRKKLRNPAIRKKVLYEMEMGIPYKNSDPKDVMLLGFQTDTLNSLFRWKRLDEAARIHGKSPDETAIDLIVLDRSRVEAIYFLQSERNVRKIIQQPYVSFGSDAGSIPITKEFTDGGTHPRTYGTFARVFAEYVRKEKLITWEEAIRRMTSLPAENLHIQKRGSLKVGYYADVVVLDTTTVQDHATFEDPHQYSTGVNQVFINGVQVLSDGEHTGAKPGRIVYGPGKKD
jgi:N-acyl-D-amino-acid deacylase